MGSTNCVCAPEGGEVVWFWRNTLDAIWHDKYVRLGDGKQLGAQNSPRPENGIIIILIDSNPS